MKRLLLIPLTVLAVSQVQAFDLIAHPTKAYECDECSKLSRETIQDKWQISSQSLDRSITNLQKSYSYKQQVTLEQLKQGIALYALAPGALIRINPLQGKTIPELTIKTATHKTMTLKDASVLYSQDDALAHTLLSSKHQTLLQLKDELGSGVFTLTSKSTAATDAKYYLISVFDKFSSVHLDLKTDVVHYQYGDKLRATLSLNDDFTNYSVDEVDATLISPVGERIPLKIKELENNVFEASILLSSEVNSRGENWYVDAGVQTLNQDDELIRRSVHTAFSYAIPSATLINVKKIASKPLTFVATLHVATASRYALQSVLYSAGTDGKAKPIETSQKAQWLEPGLKLIQFTFDNVNQLADDSLYLGYLRLTDYGQLKTVYQYNQPIKLTQLVE